MLIFDHANYIAEALLDKTVSQLDVIMELLFSRISDEEFVKELLEEIEKYGKYCICEGYFIRVEEEKKNDSQMKRGETDDSR